MSEMFPEPVSLINELSVEFDNFTLERHEVGQEKYGIFTFLEKDIITEALQELGDMANYARYQYIKLRMIQLALAQDPRLAQLANAEGEITIGTGSFTPGGKS